MKTLNSNTIAQFESGLVRYDYLLEVSFAETVLRLTSAPFDISLDPSGAFLSNGWLLGVRGIEETSELKAVGLSITLSGISTSLLEMILRQSSQQVTGKLYLVFFDPNWDVIETDLRFTGFLDNVHLKEDAEEPLIELNFENELIKLKTIREWRYTPNDQKILYPSDEGFYNVAFLSEQRIYWGAPDTTRGA
jgi:hypothetical protein